jgi:hypothetical protein
MTGSPVDDEVVERPRGTGLGHLRASLAVGVQWRRQWPRTVGFSGASACARDWGTAGTSWHAGVQCHAGARALEPNRFKEPLSKRNFPKIPNKSAQRFEYQRYSPDYPLQVCQRL